MFKQEITVLQTGSCGCRDETEPGKNSYFDFAARNGHACRGSEVGLIKDELRIAHQMHVYCLQTYAWDLAANRADLPLHGPKSLSVEQQVT